ncbi:MAG: MerR family transcriptional regulator [Pseudomonas sp.]|jgi:DNA-binding transcriptional MerR regulator|uniref:MerR family transcriptional regulator n=1 Tax=Pseudomonas sp. TaxID=306 RepID=UPI003C716112
MLIAEFAKVTGLSRDTIRFYVKKRLLQPDVGRSGTNRYQDFDAEQVDRALLIREKQALGFTLREIAALSEEFARGISLERQAQVMRERLLAVDEQAAKLARLRRYFVAKVAWLEGGATATPPSFAQIVGETENSVVAQY